MTRKQHSARSRITASLALALALSFVAYVGLLELPAAAISESSNWYGHPPPLADNTYTYTTFLPIVYKMCPYQSIRPPLQGTANFAGEVKILTPWDCTTGIPAETPVLATGTYSGTPASVTLWVLAYVPNSSYYPQSPDACQGVPPYQDGGNWQVPVYLGRKGGTPEWFDIVVILTDQAASQFLSNHVRRGCLSGRYVGIPAVQLNQMAIIEKSHITVQTLD